MFKYCTTQHYVVASAYPNVLKDLSAFIFRVKWTSWTNIFTCQNT